VRARLTDPSGQALVLALGLVAALLTGGLVLVALGEAVGAKSREQRAADLAAVSAAAAMRRVYPRLFEPAFLPPARPGLPRRPNPRHLSCAEYLAIARDAAARGARANGARLDPADVSFPGGSFAPTRVRVRIRAQHQIRASGLERGRVEIKARAVAELAPNAGGPGLATDGGYSGPLAYRQGKPTPHLFPAGVADKSWFGRAWAPGRGPGGRGFESRRSPSRLVAYLEKEGERPQTPGAL